MLIVIQNEDAVEAAKKATQLLSSHTFHIEIKLAKYFEISFEQHVSLTSRIISTRVSKV